MKKEASFSQLIQRLNSMSPSLGGVLGYSDLFHLIGAETEIKNNRVIRKLIRENVLYKIKRGVYITQHPDLWSLACRLKKDAYISMDSVLAKNGLIGTVPAHSVSAVTPGALKSRVETPLGMIRFFSIKADLMFGITQQSDGVRVADSEKAFLDILYYYVKGAKFVIDPLREVDVSKLDVKKLKKYLSYYKNPKFISFVNKVIQEGLV